MLTGFPYLPNIIRKSFRKGLWLFLWIVNGFGIVTGSIRYVSKLINKSIRNFASLCLFILICWSGFLVLVIQVRYKSDCEELYGRILDNSNVVSSLQCTCKRQTEEIWNRLYPDEPYDFDLTKALSENASQTLSGLEKHTKYDLISAVKRQSPFFYQVILRMIIFVFWSWNFCKHLSYCFEG